MKLLTFENWFHFILFAHISIFTVRSNGIKKGSIFANSTRDQSGQVKTTNQRFVEKSLSTENKISSH